MLPWQRPLVSGSALLPRAGPVSPGLFCEVGCAPGHAGKSGVPRSWETGLQLRVAFPLVGWSGGWAEGQRPGKGQ